MLKYSAIVCVGLALCAEQALSHEVPVYDTMKYCSSLVASAASPEVRNLMEKGCLEQEQRRQKQLGALTHYLSAEVIQRCDSLARLSTGGSYQMFAGCLAMDIADQFLEGKIEIIRKQ